MNPLGAAMAVLIEARRRNERTCGEFCECHAADRQEVGRFFTAGEPRKRSR